jgi:diguanylate cyclase (GGDEF)-like protein/PAS domain S-box-containing protein
MQPSASLNAFIELMPDAILAINEAGWIVMANAQAAALSGYTIAGLLGLDVDRLVPGKTRLQHRGHREGYLAIPHVRPMGAKKDLFLLHRDGREIPVDIRLGFLEADGERLAVAAVRDMTQAREAERRLRESEERFRGLTALSSDWYWEQDEELRFTFFSETNLTKAAVPLGDGEFGFTSFSPEPAHQISIPLGDLIGKTRFELPLQFESDEAREDHLQTLFAHKPFRNLLMKSPQTGSWVSVSGEPVWSTEGKFKGYRGVSHDVTDRKQAEEHARFLATRDPLTGLPNRTLLNDRLQMALFDAARSGRHVATMFIDLDRFKAINDTLGHDVGDRFLREVAQRLSGLFRKGDTLARLGGDEFVMVLRGLATAGDAAPIAAKVVNAVAEPFLFGTSTFQSGASVGVAVFPDDGSDASTLLRHADIAMYQAKAEGRCRFRFFSAEADRMSVPGGARAHPSGPPEEKDKLSL